MESKGVAVRRRAWLPEEPRLLSSGTALSRLPLIWVEYLGQLTRLNSSCVFFPLDPV
jgi:hypothetical protein